MDELIVEWRVGREVNPTLLMLIFQDILVFLEAKEPTVLKPLTCTLNKAKHVFSPIIPFKCIKSLGPMPDKRGLHIVVLFDDKSKTQPSQKPIETQMLFLLYAASNDIRSRCLDCLQSLTGKVTSNAPLVQIDPNQQQQPQTQNKHPNQEIPIDIPATPNGTKSDFNGLNPSKSSSSLQENEEEVKGKFQHRL